MSKRKNETYDEYLKRMREYGRFYCATYKGKRKKSRALQYIQNREELLRKSAEYQKSPAGKIMVANSQLKQRYGVGLLEYEKMLVSQNGHCACCPTEPGIHNMGRRLAIDHCHKTGRIRGLLCVKCNQALGLVSDNLDTIKSMGVYLLKR